MSVGVRSELARAGCRIWVAALCVLMFWAPAIAQERILVTFGALTLEGAGGIEVPCLSALPEALADDFVLEDGVVTPSSAGDEVNLSRGPYEAELPDGRLLEIAVLPATYSVSTFDEFKRTVAHPELAYGEAILLRAGAYAAPTVADAVISRDIPPRGDPKMDGPVQVSSHDGATSVIEHLRLGRNTSDFTYRGLVFRTKRRSGEEYRGSVEVVHPLPNLVFEDNTFAYGERIDGTEPDVVMGIFASGKVQVDGMRVVRNKFDGVRSSVRELSGNGIVIDGNEIRRATEDDIRINKGRNIRITNNLMTDKVQSARAFGVVDIRPDGRGGMLIITDRPLPRGRAVENVLLTPDTGIHPDLTRVQFDFRRHFNRERDIDPATRSIRIRNVNSALLRYRYTGGGRLLVTSAHSDAIQVYPTDFKPGDFDNMTITGNAMLIGKGSIGFNSRQGGLWVEGGRGNHRKPGWTVIGNVIEHTGRNGLVIGGLENARIWNNVVVRRLNYPKINRIGETVVSVSGTGSLYDNIANSFDLKNWRGAADGNITVPADSVTGYRRLFRDPTVGDAEYFGKDYTAGAYSPAPGAPPVAGLAGWDFATRTYKGPR